MEDALKKLMKECLKDVREIYNGSYVQIAIMTKALFKERIRLGKLAKDSDSGS